MQAEHTTDVAVLLIFSTRTASLSRTFEAVSKSRPARLLVHSLL
ncbi:MAG: hypothetical protein ACSW8D_00810 [Prevotella sp.]